MSGKKNLFITFALVLSVSFIASFFAVFLAYRHYAGISFQQLNAVCSEILRQDPKAEELLSSALKAYTEGNGDRDPKRDILTAWGYGVSDFSLPAHRQILPLAAAGLLGGSLLFGFTFLCRNQGEGRRIRALTDYLEQINTGKAAILSVHREDDFSKLEDEIYKTVTFLHHTKDAAVQAKNDFAENLSNIAHQIKTPITAISLSVQTMRREYGGKYAAQIQKQLVRLTRLEEALLVLSRLDAGTLTLEKEEVDVFTVLTLAADNLQELLMQSGTSIHIPEQGEACITADLDWTMEAMINIMKNCMEHNAGGIVHCSYETNPLYTQILIWDEGEGFFPEDIPHLFERFYRGKNPGEGGIGIGLALSKEIIERQNGTIRAQNMPEGGACFEIRFYCH